MAMGTQARARLRPPAVAAAVTALLLLLAVLPAPARASRLEPKGARITLRAKWPGTPLLHEAAEFLVRGRCLVRREGVQLGGLSGICETMALVTICPLTNPTALIPHP